MKRKLAISFAFFTIVFLLLPINSLSWIIGELDWQDVASLPQGSPEYRNAQPVAMLSLKNGDSCTGFLVSKDIMMTNRHCVRNQLDVEDLWAVFNYETPSSEWKIYECDTFMEAWGRKLEAILNDQDVALIRCRADRNGKLPGDNNGFLSLSSDFPNPPNVYLIHHPCEPASNTACDPNSEQSLPKKISWGSASHGRIASYVVPFRIQHTADMMPNSSGGPIFDSNTHSVFAINAKHFNIPRVDLLTTNLGTWLAELNPPLILANPGVDQQVTTGVPLPVDGSNSVVLFPPLSYSWKIFKKPPQSNPKLENSNTAEPVFIADKPGDYILELTVQDGQGNKSKNKTNQVKITAQADTAPPALITNFQASDNEDSQSTLTWTNPSDSNLAEIIVQRKTGGYPANHTDGNLVYLNNSPTPAVAVTYIDAGLINGTTYFYAVFSRDKAGNWNDQVTEGKNADTGKPSAPVTISTMIDTYSPQNQVEVTVGNSVLLSVTFTNIGNTPWQFIAGATVWDSNGNIVADYEKTLDTALEVSQQTTVTWQHPVNEVGDYWLQFGVWKAKPYTEENLLDKKPIPSQKLIIGAISPNGAPAITSFTANPPSVPPGGQSTISVQASDPDGDPLTYDWSATCGTLSSTTGPEDKTWTAPATPGICTVSVIVTDSFDNRATSMVNIEVTSAPIVESPWPMFGHDPQHTGRSEYTGPQSIDVRWAYDLGFAISYYCGGASLQPVVGNGEVIYFGIGEVQCGSNAPWGKLYAFNPDGTFNWESFDFGSPVFSAPAIGPDGTIYVPTYGVYALNPNGTEKWRFYEEGMGYVTSISVGSNGIIYFIDNQKLYSLNPDGSKNWVFCCGPRGGTPREGPAIGANGDIYVVWTGFITGTDGQNGELHAYSPDGTLKWSVQLNYGYIRLTAPSVGHDGTVYVADGYYSGVGWRLNAFNQGGQQIWQTPIVGPGYPQGSPVIDAKGNIIVAANWTQLCGEITWCFASGLWTFSPGGDVIWTIGPHGGQSSNNTRLTQPIMDAQGTIFIAENVSGPGGWVTVRLYSISQQGVVEQTIDVPGTVFSSPIIGADGHLYALLPEHQESVFYRIKFYAFGP